MAKHTLIAVALGVAFVALQTAHATWPEPRYAKAKLPADGKFLRHPTNGSEYYFLPVDFTGRRANVGARPGLYYSPADSGGEFKILRVGLDFRDVYVHPTTGKLFAIIGWQHVYQGKDDVIAKDMGMIAVSDDGRRWKDVTPPDFSVNVSMKETVVTGKIQQDPERRNRVCVVRRDPNGLGYGNDPIGFVLRASDDEHTKWEIIRMPKWQEVLATTRAASRAQAREEQAK
jgi:hypothetical protein